MELRVGNRYRLGRKIGSGSFGDIYLGKEGGSRGMYPVGLRHYGERWGPGRDGRRSLTSPLGEVGPGAAPETSFHPSWSSGCAAVQEKPFDTKHLARGTAVSPLMCR